MAIGSKRDTFPEKYLDTNSMISRSVVDQHKLLEMQLKKLGVDIRPHYTISPPLGDALRHMFNRSAESDFPE